MNLPVTPRVLAPLNQGQQAAADAFFQFLFTNEKEFIISGPGGTGKTHLMSFLIDVIMPRYFETCKLMNLPPVFEEVKMTATTNKAAEVVAVATQRPTDTVHSFLALKVSDDYLTGEQKLVQTNAWKIHDKLILFVDECSMIDHALLELIREGTKDCKIVYVGDHCQLAPVKEVISPIYRRQPPIPFYQLTEQMRTNNPDLMALHQQLRETVETGVFKSIRIIPGVIDLLSDADMAYAIDRVFKQQTMDSRILAYTNNRVLEYNDHIRTLRQLPDEFQPGEFLVNNHAIRLKGAMLSVEEEVSIGARSETTEKIEIEDNVFFEYRRCDLDTTIGGTYQDVRIPVDRGHYRSLLAHYKRRKNWHKFFELKNNYPDLRQRDAATVHKSQGSTYDSVFIDTGNISTCNFQNQVARMLYVACTRPRSRIFFYGALAEKYGGFII